MFLKEAGHRLVALHDPLFKEEENIDKKASLSKYRRMYDTFDAGHDREHMKAVVREAKGLGKKYAPEHRKLIRMAAILHDVGLAKGRKGHGQFGYDMISADQKIKKKLSSEDRDVLLEAIREHRASSGKPQHVVSKIVSDADRLASSDAAGALQRVYDYRIKSPEDYCKAFPEAPICGKKKLTGQEAELWAIEDGLNHLVEKYKRGGRGRRSYFPETAQRLDEVYDPIIEIAAKKDYEKALGMIEKQSMLGGIRKLADS